MQENVRPIWISRGMAARIIGELLFWRRNKIRERRSVGSPSMTNKAKQARVLSNIGGKGSEAATLQS